MKGIFFAKYNEPNIENSANNKADRPLVLVIIMLLFFNL